ncbi:hypothetical protein RhiirA1_539511 [Rhizophagus irregularis]|uniref:Uncharacterized protein n=1 Tax=Rhizophagus irregularis TaxID=588596 RepID=A0A2N0RCB5_9GLOM|nr:hypothetical protein RhiirA1_539511 [Rhizophagus irregularis]
MTANLANLQQFELSRQKQIDRITNKIIYLESANITQDFPLQQGDYVIVLYGMKICIAKVIAMYYEGYGNHCYSQNAVTQIEDLSYISLQVYLPIHLNIFASQTVEGYTLFTHHCPQNIIYHIKSNGVIIGDSSLTLTGVARDTFNYFNRNTIKNTTLVGLSRRFRTDKMSQKNPQDASELTKCLRRPSRCFRTDEMSQKINKERKGDF